MKRPPEHTYASPPLDGLPLFDRSDATAKRDQAIDRVAVGAAVDWTDLAMDAVVAAAKGNWSFTTDDVLRQAPALEACPERRLLGWAMREASRAGMIAKTDTMAQSDRVASHRREKRLWRSLICERGAS